MRSLKLCGVRLALSADDLGFPALAGFGLRVVWLIFNIVFLLISTGSILPACNVKSDLDFVYYILGICINIACLTLYGIIAWVANQGTIVEHEKRNNMSRYVTLLIVVYFLQLCINFYGTYALSVWNEENSECEERMLVLVFSVIW